MDPKNTTIVSMGHPKKVPFNLGEPHMDNSKQPGTVNLQNSQVRIDPQGGGTHGPFSK